MSTVKDKVVTVGNKEYLKLSTVFEDLDWGDYKITESGSESRYQFDKISGLSGKNRKPIYRIKRWRTTVTRPLIR